MDRADVIIIGGGIAGASAAYFLSAGRRVIVVERESQPGYHTTGRSAALYTQAYGSGTARALTVGARGFFEAPPAHFGGHPLITPRGLLFIGRKDQHSALEQHFKEALPLIPEVRRLSADETLSLCPILRPEQVAGGVLEPDASDIDVASLLAGYVRGLRSQGGRLVTDAEVLELECAGGSWSVRTTAGDFAAPVVVNAAGAWADPIAERAGVAALGLVPKRRTAFVVDLSADLNPASWPMVVDADEQFYFKPDAGRLLVSPADETPSPPCDAQAEELDVAIAADRLERATTLSIRRIAHRWAGLRTFAPGNRLVAGFDPDNPGFFWLVGQGGYGVQTSPSMGRVAAALIGGSDVPDDLKALGVTQGDLSPLRSA